MESTYSFPYITSIHVNDCYTYQNFDIVLNSAHQPFSHLVLTGKNGSGKSTILKSLAANLKLLYSTGYKGLNKRLFTLSSWINDNPEHEFYKEWVSEITLIKNIKPQFGLYPFGPKEYPYEIGLRDYIYSYLNANRVVRLDRVETVTNEESFSTRIYSDDSSEFFRNKFKQYLVNKKIEQAFNIIENNQQGSNETDSFFRILTESFKRIFEDDSLSLNFIKERFDFYIELSNNQRIAFENFSEGFASFVSILMDLFLRVDLLRKKGSSFNFQPCGVVLIDEPENHLHLKLQYEIMPLLTNLFPNIQFIIATHSPAVISSIKNATVFDLTSKNTESDRIAGSSFSELMISHFGLENEYSPVADAIFEQLNQVLRSEHNPKRRKTKLQNILQQNKAYLSPALQLEIESMILNTPQDVS